MNKPTPVQKQKEELLIDLPLIHKPKGEQKLNVESSLVNYDKLVSLHLDSRYEKISKLDQKQIIPFMVTYKAKDEKMENERVGLDLVMIIDISGSMSGQKIELVRETLLFVIDELHERDRLSLIKFDNVSTILTNLSPMTPETKQKFKEIVNREIHACADTNINIGLIDGFQVLLNRKQVNDVTAMFLLSDGQDTCGNTVDTFSTTLNNYDKMMKEKNMDYKINSFGYGTGHDEKVLASISSFKNGSFYYIKDVKLVDECFIECLGMLLSIFATKAEITVFLSNGARFVKKYGKNWDSQGSMSKGTLHVGNISVGVEKNFMAEIEVPALAGQQGVIKIAQAILSFETKEKSFNIDADLNLALADGQDLGQASQKVEENLLRVQAAETIAEAEEDYKKGKGAEAKAKIHTFKAQVKANNLISMDYACNLGAMVEDEAYTDSKNMRQLEDALAFQAYKPGMKANLAPMNSVQNEMLRKKKS